MIGPATTAMLRAQVQRRVHPEQAIRSGLGILRLAKDFSAPALEAACERALAIHSFSYRAVRALLQLPAATTVPVPPPTIPHAHLRGADYYKDTIAC